ncbi:MAG: endonuclease [Nitrospirota bacterium]|nr:endonuclease [Nitrospirota bacterium]
MTDVVYDIVKAALGGMNASPMPLSAALSFYSKQSSLKKEVTEKQVIQRVSSDPNDLVRSELHRKLAEWDHTRTSTWTGSTQPNSESRRQLIYKLLKISSESKTIISDVLPFYDSPPPILIEDPGKHENWYAAVSTNDFYWGQFKSYLGTTKKWTPESLELLDQSTYSVVERLDCPWLLKDRRSRGLVVGYVQSGKTTHFTGVIAKAIDAGYRLIIVLSGTMDLLRNQTQRRLDMDLVGKENILRGNEETEVADHDYSLDRDWPRFMSHGSLPSRLGSVDIFRLTGAVDDFRSLAQGISALEFEKKEKNKPLYYRENLGHANARLIVVKKNKLRLKQLVKDLSEVNRESRDYAPALIIDDESDQASVNTLNPKKITDEKSRTAINKLIVDLLKKLPRAQYVGYTATPIANVFVSRADSDDIYPKHYILSLRKPEAYMGVTDFHDFETRSSGISNKSAHLRSIPRNYQDIAEDGDATILLPDNCYSGSMSWNSEDRNDIDRLLEAMDAFVLAGAIKLFRKSRGVAGEYRHHTMLVHESHLQIDQRNKKELLEKLWKHKGYDSTAGMARLKMLYDNDFAELWRRDRDRAAGLPVPESFNSLKKYLGAAIDNIGGDNKPVLIVNGERDADTPDFDLQDKVWKIIVGGAKLSRGYTIEGLTVSYFRRRAQAADTLMQMGRWFGFRKGYRDLVRLYMGRMENDGKQNMDLYEAFGAMCQDEEKFRSQLDQYSEPGPDGKYLTPLEVPALVYNSYPRLRPAAANKMYHAELVSASFYGKWREPIKRQMDATSRKIGAAIFEKALLSAKMHEGKVGKPGTAFQIKWLELGADTLVNILKRYPWPDKISPIQAELNFLHKNRKEIPKWVIVIPQLTKTRFPVWNIGGHELSSFGRTVIAGTDRFKAFSEPRHADFAHWLVDLERNEGEGYTVTAGLKKDRKRGVMLLYPAYPMDELGTKAIPLQPVMGFALLLPKPENVQGNNFEIVYRVKGGSDIKPAAPKKKKPAVVRNRK